nr:hypothetical protein [Brevibacterium daeguense]
MSSGSQQTVPELLPEYDLAPRAAPGIFDSARWRRWLRELLFLPVWLQALAVYLVSRLVSVGIMAAVVRRQELSPWTTGARTSLNDFLNFWDAAWYQRIADEGYPSELPRGVEGEVLQNQWAFYPLHPWIVRDISDLTGIDYQVISPIFATLCGAAAAVVVLVLFRRHTTPGRALFGLAVLFFFPASAIFSTGYAESLTLLLQALALLLVIERRYLLAIPVVFLMDLSRPIGVAFSFFMLIHLIDRFLRRRTIPYPAGEVVRSWALGVLSCAAALVHPLLAWIRTGTLTAYTDTEAAWSGGHTRIIVQWFARAEDLVGPFGPLLLFGTIALVLALIYSPAGRQMGRTLQHFCLAYGIYILLFFNPQTSTLRLLLPMFPIALALAFSRSWAYRVVLLAAFTLFQVIWVAYLWHFTPPSDLPP